MNISSGKMLAILSGRFSVGEEYEPGLFLFRAPLYQAHLSGYTG